MRTLSVSLRPRNFGQMFGQDSVIAAIKNQVATKRMPAAWFLSGESGAGKTTLAKILALSHQCTHAKFGYPCKECRRNRKQFTIAEHNAALHNKVEAITEIAALSEYAPDSGSQYRVVVMNEVQRITPQAQAILLDYLEFPPASTVWIFTTTEPEKILKALRRRCFRLALRSLKSSDVGAFVKWAAKRGEITRPLGDFIEELHRVGVTSAGIMLMALERYAAGLDPQQAVLVADIDVDALRVCQNLVKGNWAPIRSELEKASPDDARAIRASVLAYMKSAVLNPKSGMDKKALCSAIEDLGRVQYIDDVAITAMMTAVLFRLCKKF